MTDREHPTPGGQAAGTCPGSLFPLQPVSSGQGGGRGGRESSCFYCAHNFLTNSFHESLGDLCLFIYLAPSSFLKSRLLRALKVRTAPVVAVLVALLASQLSSASRNIFWLTHLALSVAVTGQVKGTVTFGHTSLELMLSTLAHRKRDEERVSLPRRHFLCYSTSSWGVRHVSSHSSSPSFRVLNNTG